MFEIFYRYEILYRMLYNIKISTKSYNKQRRIIQVVGTHSCMVSHTLLQRLVHGRFALQLHLPLQTAWQPHVIISCCAWKKEIESIHALQIFETEQFWTLSLPAIPFQLYAIQTLQDEEALCTSQDSSSTHVQLGRLPAVYEVLIVSWDGSIFSISRPLTNRCFLVLLASSSSEHRSNRQLQSIPLKADIHNLLRTRRIG